MSEIEQTKEELIEGLDSSDESTAWGDYPLDSVFVRQEQRTVREIMGRIEKERYVLDPDFQRDFIWPPLKQSRLIESCLMRIPLPVFYVAEAKDGRIIVVDGLQRLMTFYRYINNKFPLAGLINGSTDILNNKRFKDLPLNLQERIEDTQLVLYILDAKAPERAKLDIFERVNGGVPLTRQQMRNCLFNGPATKWLKKVADSTLFLNVTGHSLDKKKMRDREVINRFCAFRLLGPEKYKGDMDDFLAMALELMNKLNEIELEDLDNYFKQTLSYNKKLFGKHAFRKSLSYKDKYASKSVINVSLFDVCSVLLADMKTEYVDNNLENLRNAMYNLLYDELFINAITYSTNSTIQVKRRFMLMWDALKEIS